jgi:hypothetical protein
MARVDLKPHECAEAPDGTPVSGTGLFTVVATNSRAYNSPLCIECQTLGDLKGVLRKLTRENIETEQKDYDRDASYWEVRVYAGSELSFDDPRVWWDELVEKGLPSSEEVTQAFNEVEAEFSPSIPSSISLPIVPLSVVPMSERGDWNCRHRAVKANEYPCVLCKNFSHWERA